MKKKPVKKRTKATKVTVKKKAVTKKVAVKKKTVKKDELTVVEKYSNVAGLIAVIIALLAIITFFPEISYSQDKKLRVSSLCTRYFEPYETTYGIPSDLLKSVAHTESGIFHKASKSSIPWPWTINVHGKGYRFQTKQEAISAVKKFKSQGKTSIDVGCMQINLKFHPEAFNDLDQAFEPKYNIGYAAKFLHTNFKKTKNWKKAVGRYHSGTYKHASRYIRHVYAKWNKAKAKKGIKVASLNK